jgi:DNA-binding NarL/FixJ family response regulator
MRVMVVDDHPVVVDAVKTVLHTLHPSASVIEASSLSEACAIASSSKLDLILLDLTLPDSQGSDSVSSLRAVATDVPIAVFSGVNNPAMMIDALDHGAMAFIPKTMPRLELIDALKHVLAGHGYLPANLVGGGAATAVSMGAGSRHPTADLTDRQREVLSLLVQGTSNKGICQRLQISENTVKVHVSAIFRILGVANRTQAVLAAHRGGIKLPRIV